MTSRFATQEDRTAIAMWYADRGLPVPPSELLPPTCIVVPDVAAGFLYGTDSYLCIIDNYISNAKKTVSERHSALDLITKELITYGSLSGYTHALIFTSNKRIVDRAHQWGFDGQLEKFMMIKEIA